MSAGPIVTFYSYKGGVGRTLTLANAAALLSQWGYKVLCIDWDLEAPGLHLYFQHHRDVSRHPGLTELICAQADCASPRWEDYVAEIPLPGARHKLDLITAGAQDESYVRRVQTLEWPALYERHDLGVFLERLRDDWKARYDFVLIDSRTGITDIGGICTVQLPDHLVLLFTANYQSLRGAVDVARRASNQRNRLPFDRGRLLTLPVASRFERRVEYAIAHKWLQTFASELDPLFAEWAHSDVSAQELLNFTRTPYVAYWSFGEKLPVLEEGTRDPESLGFALETITAILAQGFSGTDMLVRNRDTFVEAARRGAPTAPLPAMHGAAKAPPVRVFMSYSHRDKPLAEELQTHLGLLKRQGLVASWHDRTIAVGDAWDHAIDPHVEAADVILLLVSANFLASDYAYDKEMRRALERMKAGEARVVPIIVRPCDWSSSPLAELQVLPQSTQPVTTWDDRDDAWAHVSRGIRHIIEEHSARKPGS